MRSVLVVVALLLAGCAEPTEGLAASGGGVDAPGAGASEKVRNGSTTWIVSTWAVSALTIGPAERPSAPARFLGGNFSVSWESEVKFGSFEFQVRKGSAVLWREPMPEPDALFEFGEDDPRVVGMDDVVVWGVRPTGVAYTHHYEVVATFLIPDPPSRTTPSP